MIKIPDQALYDSLHKELLAKGYTVVPYLEGDKPQGIVITPDSLYIEKDLDKHGLSGCADIALSIWGDADGRIDVTKAINVAIAVAGALAVDGWDIRLNPAINYRIEPDNSTKEILWHALLNLSFIFRRII